MKKITPIIISGGSGTRLWPLSRKSYPKQFLDIFGKESLFQQTIKRVANQTIFNPAIIIANYEHRFLINEELKKINYQSAEIILESESRNTAPAITIGAIATIKKHQENDIVLIMPCDHLIKDNNNFLKYITSLTEINIDNLLLTFGIKPLFAESGYGYIERAENPLSCKNEQNLVYQVKNFIEKPNKSRAEELIKNPLYLWNSGIFAFRASFLLGEISKHCPDILQKCQLAYSQSLPDLNFTCLDKIFSNNENISIDYALIEKSANVAVLPLNIDWSDVGNWRAVADMTSQDADNNSLIGDAYSLDSSNCYVYSLYSTTTIIGVDNLIIINLKDSLLIANKNNAQQVKDMVEILQKKHSNLLKSSSKKLRPWGSFEIIDIGNNFKLKKIIVKPYSALSLQLHKHRSEHWIIISGVAEVIRGEESFILNVDESTYIKSGTKHRLVNNQDEALEIIEVQTGSYLGEDDIVRFDDRYGR